MKKMQKLLIIDETDNVAVALDDVQRGDRFTELSLMAAEDIPRGHKMALTDIQADGEVIKYGCPIGHAVSLIEKGCHVHTHNVKTNLEGIVDYGYNPSPEPVREIHARHFMGYLRKNGDVGVRNEVWIINTVGCVNKVAERLAAIANERFAGKTDGIFAFTHPYGCSQMGEDQVLTQKILAGLVNNPNAAGVLVLGLGCENNQIDCFRPFMGGYDPGRVKFLSIQESNDEIEEGVGLLLQIIQDMRADRRQKLPVAKLRIGLNCGGSDGFSGITANPLLGQFSDQLIDCGGTVILTEVPEMFGAETSLMNRCRSREIFDDTVSMINHFKDYYARYGQPIYENPSPGNKKGGITTLEEKSLGCVQKGGTRQVTAVLDYGQKAVVSGLNLLNGPGNDIVSNTSLAASGAQIILFTTGRGTPIGGPVPTVKISSNTPLFRQKPHWIDFDAGVLLQDMPMERLSGAFFEYVLSVSSGEVRTRNEINGYREISLFKDGVTL